MLRNQYEILGIGAPIVDLILHVDEEVLTSLPGRKGGMELIDEQTFNNILQSVSSKPIYIPGGSTANVLKGLANLGHYCAFTGKIGDDFAAKIFLAQLQALRIESLCMQAQGPTAQVISLVTPDGQRTCRSYLGVAAKMQASDLTAQLFQNVKLMHIEGYGLEYPSLVQQAMEYAKQADVKISFDLASFEIVERHSPEIFNLLKDYVNVVFANAEEALALTGASPDEACRALAAYCDIAVVSMAKDGCWVGQKNEVFKCPAYPVIARDSTGAGDFFAAGFLHGYLKSAPLQSCAHYGALLGAAVVVVEGAQIPAATWDQLHLQIPL